VTRHWRGGTLSQPEVEWDETEQAWMLALEQYRKGRCPHCTGDLEVTTDPKNEGRFKHEPAIECFRCKGFVGSHDDYKDQDSRALLHLVPLSPKR
jgi:hypothetical protein